MTKHGETSFPSSHRKKVEAEMTTKKEIQTFLRDFDRWFDQLKIPMKEVEKGCKLRDQLYQILEHVGES